MTPMVILGVGQVSACGAGVEALEEALHVARFARKTWILSPTPTLRADERLVREALDDPERAQSYQRQVDELLSDESIPGFEIIDPEIDDLIRSLPDDRLALELNVTGVGLVDPGDQVEERREQHGEAGQADDQEEPTDPGAVVDLPAVELERRPTERLEEPFDVVDGAHGVRDIPQQHHGAEQQGSRARLALMSESLSLLTLS